MRLNQPYARIGLFAKNDERPAFAGLCPPLRAPCAGGGPGVRRVRFATKVGGVRRPLGRQPQCVPIRAGVNLEHDFFDLDGQNFALPLCLGFDKPHRLQLAQRSR